MLSESARTLAAERRVAEPEGDEGDRAARPTSVTISSVRPIRRPKIVTPAVTSAPDARSSGPGDERDRVPHHVGEPEREQEELQLADPLPSDRPPEHDLEREREPRRHHDTEQGGDDERQVERVRSDQHVRAEGEELAVGEVHEAEDAEDQRQADGAEREVVPGDDPVERRLRELVPALADSEPECDQRDDDAERGERMPPHDGGRRAERARARIGVQGI